MGGGFATRVDDYDDDEDVDDDDDEEEDGDDCSSLNYLPIVVSEVAVNQLKSVHLAKDCFLNKTVDKGQQRLNNVNKSQKRKE